MKKILALVAVLVSLPATSADYSNHKELYMKNEAGGVVALTLEPCQFPEILAKGFKERAYATEGNGAKHEGCWLSPEINPADLPAVDAHIKIIPVVNLWFEGEIVAFPQSYFKPSDL